MTYRDPWELNDQTVKADQETTKHERRLEKMTTKQLVKKYGTGIIPKWRRYEQTS